MASDRGNVARKVHRALAHPLRVQILEAAADRASISPVDLAAELGASLGVVSYHVRTLAAAGLLELSDTEFRRGAVKHHYRAVPSLDLTASLRVSSERADALTESIRRLVAGGAGAEGEGDVELTVVVHREDVAKRG